MKTTNKKINFLPLAVICSLLLSSCATRRDMNYNSFNREFNNFEQNNFSQPYAQNRGEYYSLGDIFISVLSVYLGVLALENRSNRQYPQFQK